MTVRPATARSDLRRAGVAGHLRGALPSLLWGMVALTISFACTAWAIATLVNMRPPAPLPDCPSGSRLYAEAAGRSRIPIAVFHCFYPDDRVDIGDSVRDSPSVPQDMRPALGFAPDVGLMP